MRVLNIHLYDVRSRVLYGGHTYSETPVSQKRSLASREKKSSGLHKINMCLPLSSWPWSSPVMPHESSKHSPLRHSIFGPLRRPHLFGNVGLSKAEFGKPRVAALIRPTTIRELGCKGGLFLFPSPFLALPCLAFPFSFAGGCWGGVFLFLFFCNRWGVEEALLLLLLSRACGREGEETDAGTAGVHVRGRSNRRSTKSERNAKERRRDKATTEERLSLFSFSLSLSSPRTLI